MEQMKRKLSHNIGLKLISVLIAGLIWLIVSNNNDPEVTRVIKNVPITFKNQEVITRINKSYTVVDGVEKVNIYVTGRKSVTNKLNANAFQVKADLQNYNEALSTVPLEVTCLNNRVGQEDIRMVPSTIKLTMEDKIEESFGIAATLNGKTEKGYEIGKTSLVSGDTVKIAGPSSLINIIGKVTVAVDISDMKENIEDVFPIRIEDKNGAPFTENQMSKLEIKNADGVILSDNKARVAVQIWKLYQDIPVQIDVVGEPAEGYRVSRITLTPKTVNLVSDEESIKEIDEGLKLVESISVEGLSESQDYVLDLNDTLEQYENIRLEADTTSMITVHIDIAVSGSRTLMLPISAMHMENVPAEKKLIFSPADFVPISVKTEDQDIDELTIDDIDASIDLKNCSVNDNYTIPVKVTVPEGYEVVGDVSLVVNIDDLDNEAEVEADTEVE